MQELETELDAEQKSLKEKKAEVTELNELMSVVRSSCFELRKCITFLSIISEYSRTPSVFWIT